MLRDAANAAKRDDVEVLDVAEIVARNLVSKPGVGADFAVKQDQ
jgi:hypothetical protein